MKARLLLIASSLLFIAGCESELDRCIEANTSKFGAIHVADEELSSDDIYKMQHPLVLEWDAKHDKFDKEYKDMGCELGENESDNCRAMRKPFWIASEVEWLELKEVITQDIKLARKAAIQESAKNLCNTQGIY